MENEIPFVIVSDKKALTYPYGYEQDEIHAFAYKNGELNLLETALPQIQKLEGIPIDEYLKKGQEYQDKIENGA